MDVNQHRLPLRVATLRLLQRRAHLLHGFHGDADGAHAFGDLGVVAAHFGHAVALPRGREKLRRVSRHATVVQHHRGDGQPFPGRSLDV